MAYTIIERPAFQVMGIAVRTDNAHAQENIGGLWQRFKEEKATTKIPHKSSEEVFGLYTDYESDHNGLYTLVVGCAVDKVEEIPAGFAIKNVSAAKFAHFVAAGPHPMALVSTWMEVWSSGLDRTFMSDYEVYGSQFAEQPPVVNLYIAIK
ncbi:MAG: GyrI-like domain-containing protein [Chlamydiales bacterium]|nr:GyrI-like domain-containing protein [Chlamydiales bacterium]